MESSNRTLLHLCASCSKSRANIQLLPCGHTFHARCIFPWPIVICPLCTNHFAKIEILSIEPLVFQEKAIYLKSSNYVYGILRRGRWTDEEREYAELIRSIFASGAAPIAKDTKLVNFLCRMLQCCASRLSSKVKTGKKVFHPRKLSAISTAEINHFQKLQRNLSMLEERFINKLASNNFVEEACIISFHIQRVWTRHFLQLWAQRYNIVPSTNMRSDIQNSILMNTLTDISAIYNMKAIAQSISRSNIARDIEKVDSYFRNFNDKPDFEFGIAYDTRNKRPIYLCQSFKNFIRNFPGAESIDSYSNKDFNINVDAFACLGEVIYGWSDILSCISMESDNFRMTEAFNHVFQDLSDNNGVSVDPMSSCNVKMYRRSLFVLNLMYDDVCLCEILVCFNVEEQVSVSCFKFSEVNVFEANSILNSEENLEKIRSFLSRQKHVKSGHSVGNNINNGDSDSDSDGVIEITHDHAMMSEMTMQDEHPRKVARKTTTSTGTAPLTSTSSIPSLPHTHSANTTTSLSSATAATTSTTTATTGATNSTNLYHHSNSNSHNDFASLASAMNRSTSNKGSNIPYSAQIMSFDDAIGKFNPYLASLSVFKDNNNSSSSINSHKNMDISRGLKNSENIALDSIITDSSQFKSYDELLTSINTMSQKDFGKLPSQSELNAIAEMSGDTALTALAALSTVPTNPKPSLSATSSSNPAFMETFRDPSKSILNSNRPVLIATFSSRKRENAEVNDLRFSDVFRASHDESNARYSLEKSCFLESNEPKDENENDAMSKNLMFVSDSTSFSSAATASATAALMALSPERPSNMWTASNPYGSLALSNAFNDSLLPKPLKSSFPVSIREKISSVDAAMQAMLRYTPFDLAEVWIPVSTKNHETMLFFGGSASLRPEFKGWASYSRNFVFASQVGLPGRVSTARRPESFQDVSSLSRGTYLRVQGAKCLGIHASVGIPINSSVNNQDAVMVFYSKEVFEPHKNLIDFLSDLMAKLAIKTSVEAEKPRFIQTFQESFGRGPVCFESSQLDLNTGNLMESQTNSADSSRSSDGGNSTLSNISDGSHHTESGHDSVDSMGEF